VVRALATSAEVPGFKTQGMGFQKKKTVARDYEKKLSVHQAVSGYLGNV